MKVGYTVTYYCEYTIDPHDEEWQEEDDDGNFSFNEEYALDRLHDLVRDATDEYTNDYAQSIDISEMKVISR